MGNTGVNRLCHDCWRRALHLYLYAISISAERKQLLTRALRSKSTCLDIFAVDSGAAFRQVGGTARQVFFSNRKRGLKDIFYNNIATPSFWYNSCNFVIIQAQREIVIRGIFFIFGAGFL
jgi:hypothetical protein